MRPLDPVRSIKAKLGVLVAVTVAVAAVLPLAGSRLGLDPLLTVPVTVAGALLLTQLPRPRHDVTAARDDGGGPDDGHRRLLPPGDGVLAR